MKSSVLQTVTYDTLSILRFPSTVSHLYK